MARPKLTVVADVPEAVDIYTAWKAEIQARPWSDVHTKGDRNPPLEIADRPKRGWRA